ncbi:MAG: hypothetical protein JO314_02260 [Acidobacteria bacterium]|nr:hypothetical protein [Acidobacteriota bacterium]
MLGVSFSYPADATVSVRAEDGIVAEVTLKKAAGAKAAYKFSYKQRVFQSDGDLVTGVAMMSAFPKPPDLDAERKINGSDYTSFSVGMSMGTVMMTSGYYMVDQGKLIMIGLDEETESEKAPATKEERAAARAGFYKWLDSIKPVKASSQEGLPFEDSRLGLTFWYPADAKIEMDDANPPAIEAHVKLKKLGGAKGEYEFLAWLDKADACPSASDKPEVPIPADFGMSRKIHGADYTPFSAVLNYDMGAGAGVQTTYGYYRVNGGKCMTLRLQETAGAKARVPDEERAAVRKAFLKWVDTIKSLQ